jgi:hypothetical protein
LNEIELILSRSERHAPFEESLKVTLVAKAPILGAKCERDSLAQELFEAMESCVGVIVRGSGAVGLNERVSSAGDL